jgi:hypothetical protein
MAMDSHGERLTLGHNYRSNEVGDLQSISRSGERMRLDILEPTQALDSWKASSRKRQLDYLSIHAMRKVVCA